MTLLCFINILSQKKKKKKWVVTYVVVIVVVVVVIEGEMRRMWRSYLEEGGIYLASCALDRHERRHFVSWSELRNAKPYTHSY
jgi:drug/metabolite transporter superfamily protein YnfA